MAVLMFQKDSTLAALVLCTHETSTSDPQDNDVALARKLLIALWRLVREGVIPEGIVLRPAL